MHRSVVWCSSSRCRNATAEWRKGRRHERLAVRVLTVVGTPRRGRRHVFCPATRARHGLWHRTVWRSYGQRGWHGPRAALGPAAEGPAGGRRVSGRLNAGGHAAQAAILAPRLGWQGRPDPPTRNRPQAIYLRIRRPQSRPLASVFLNGQPHDRFHREKEWIILPGTLSSRQEIVAQY